jgi:predicted unusual protein kinase regulating ubiquinone biosynthesis (AarF/ABC1/UbiB family)
MQQLTVYKTARFVFEYNTKFKRLNRAERGPWLTKQIGNLGPTYVKMAQFVANRKDVVDKDVAEALRQLQSDVRPLEEAEIDKIIASNFDVLSNIVIEKTPIASASIAQVHRGVVTSSNGRRDVVAVKLLRPGIKDSILKDTAVLLLVLRCLQRVGVKDVQESIGIIETFRDSILKETDFGQEIANMTAFAANNDVKDGLGASIRIPRVFPELCSENVIVMEHVASHRFDDLSERLTPTQRSQVAYALMDQMVRQFLRGSVMHGDPHGGNIGIEFEQDGSSEFRFNIVYYDFGNVVYIDSRVRTAIKSLIFELMFENTKGVKRLLMNWPDLLEIKDAAQSDYYIAMYIEYIKKIDFAVFRNAKSKAATVTMSEAVPIKMSGKLLEVMRVFGLVEGLCVQLDPGFSYMKAFETQADSFLFDMDFMWYKASTDIDNLLS